MNVLGNLLIFDLWLICVFFVVMDVGGVLVV